MVNSKNNLFHREEIYRGSLKEIATLHITVCGAGALGSNLVDNLVRQGFSRLRVIDFDRVEIHNVNTQIYSKSHVGALKVASLKQIVFGAVGVEIETENKKLDETNIKKLLKNTMLVVDMFDNSASRKIITDYCLENKVKCLHVGLSGDGYGEAVWNEKYKVPQDTDDVDPCQVGLARNLIILTVASATEEIINFSNKEPAKNYTITLKDLKIKSTQIQ